VTGTRKDNFSSAYVIRNRSRGLWFLIDDDHAFIHFDWECNMMWNARMLALTGNAQHADVIERALYNGINSGMSLDGRTYCYRNPLAYDPVVDAGDRHTPSGRIRNPWYDTTCCPPNLERTFASLPGYFYSTASDGV
jgi:uncharacterized protein